ncbi:MAG: glycosyltransferase family 4 protein [Patescibacteria group bacterium]
MKILYLITKSTWGGAQRNVFDLAKSMKHAGHEVAVALGGDGILRKRLEDAGIYTHSISKMGRDISISQDTGSLREIISVIRHRKPDVLHVHSPKAAGLGALAGRLLRVKNIVYTVHGWAFNEDRPLHQKIVIIFFSWLTMLLCHNVIVLSKYEYVQSMRFPFTKRKIQLVPLGIQSPTFMSVDGAKQTISKMLGMGLPDFNKRVAIGVIAELHPNKGLSYLIEALSTVAHQYPHVLCIIIGEGQDRDMLTLDIQQRHLEDHVRLVGYLENASEYLKAFSIFVLPSIKEGLPYVLFEAGYASLPVLSTTVGGIPEIVEDTKSGILVQPHKSRELAHALSFLIEQPTERRKYGAALRERTLREFSFDQMITATETIYRLNS